MLLTEKTFPSDDTSIWTTETHWSSVEGLQLFTYDHDYAELWDESQLWGEDDPAFPIAKPKTLEQARSIIESKGYTIA